jgi:hypothetical protein
VRFLLYDLPLLLGYNKVVTDRLKRTGRYCLADDQRLLAVIFALRKVDIGAGQCQFRQFFLITGLQSGKVVAKF